MASQVSTVEISSSIFQVYSITNKEAETPHEAAFHKRFREAIDSTMLKIRKPADPSKPKDAWGGFLHLQVWNAYA